MSPSLEDFRKTEAPHPPGLAEELRGLQGQVEWKKLVKQLAPELAVLGGFAILALLKEKKKNKEPEAPEAPAAKLADLKAAVAAPGAPPVSTTPLTQAPSPAERPKKPPEIMSRTVTPMELFKAMAAYRNCVYQWGGSGKNGEGIDCSGTIIEALKSLGVPMGDTTAEGLHDRFTVLKQDPKAVKVGDLVFWKPRQGEEGGREITHVAVVNEVLGNGKVRVTQMNSAKGYSETQIVDLSQGTSKTEFSFGTPLFYSRVYHTSSAA